MKLTVKEDSKLLEYLYQNLKIPKKKIKSYLTHEMIYINNQMVTQFDFPLEVGTIITIDTKNKKNLLFDILYEDQFIVVVNKPSGLLTISTAKEKKKTLYHYVSEYVKTSGRNNKVFIVHRLDQETSGIVIFAKDEKTKNMLQKDWNQLVKVREYQAVIHGNFEKKHDKLVDRLLETRTNLVYITKKNEGKEAITNYQVLKENEKYSLLKIHIETGRKNQIRVQLASRNHPIVGDHKYGKDSFKRLYLHANKLKLYYPILKKNLIFQSEVPVEFRKVI